MVEPKTPISFFEVILIPLTDTGIFSFSSLCNSVTYFTRLLFARCQHCNVDNIGYELEFNIAK